MTYPLNKVDNLINGVGVGEPVVDIGDNIHADITEKVPWLDIIGEGSLAEASDSEKSEVEFKYLELELTRAHFSFGAKPTKRSLEGFTTVAEGESSRLGVRLLN